MNTWNEEPYILSLWFYGKKFNRMYGLGHFQLVTHISPSLLTQDTKLWSQRLSVCVTTQKCF